MYVLGDWYVWCISQRGSWSESLRATTLEYTRHSMCLLNKNLHHPVRAPSGANWHFCSLSFSVRTSLFPYTLLPVSYCDHLGYNLLLYCHAPNSTLNQILFTRSYCLLICDFWSFSEHLQMPNFIHFWGCSRNLSFSSDQHGYWQMAIAPQLIFWGTASPHSMWFW